MKFLNKIKSVAPAIMMAAAALTTTATAFAQDNSILGAGSTFVNPLFSKLFSVYNTKTGIQVNYQSIGSGGGILQLTNKTVDFGDSDAPLSADQAAKMSADVLHIPMCSGAVVITYNLPGFSASLNFTPDVLADMFLGKITTWSDPRIAAINKGVSIPAFPIIIAHRSDGSGTTNIFTNYLSQVSPEWSTKVGKGGSVNWPVGLGGKGSAGVAGLIQQTPGAIGYVELDYATQNKMPISKIKNKKGNYIAPSVASTVAAGNIALPADSKIFIVNTDAADGYPIAGFTWALIYKEQNYNGRSAAKAANVVKLLWWNIHEGQQYCAALNYAQLSPASLKVAEAILKSATYNGKPIL
ncbi:MAG TPA: phosphate ABC transporter substrate-binding protein PstS [Ferruginibacter sp.]|jgi:phosphate transport system substrate-binding protein|nr:phosphate ABC transporter substrate-binding protein PstS [Ferruginibacter sp.]